MRRNKKISIVLFIFGFCFVCFPTISNQIYLSKTMITKQELEVEIKEIVEGEKEIKIPEKEIKHIAEKEKTLSPMEELFLLFQSYNTSLYEKGQMSVLDPFSFEVPSFDLVSYGFENNIIGNLKIDKLDLNIPMYLGSTKSNMANGAAILGCTSIPIGGNNTNTVIAAHRGMVSKDMFRNIQDLEIGDIVEITNFWDTLFYQVIATKIVYPDEIENILIQEGKDMITLSTCHPYRYNYQRYLVYCERIYKKGDLNEK